ncbi:hypothetical protein C7449_107270 [Mycoplana dimorpha]|uniref:Uncharacterized protein n=2 Tax=Mycoplana dimorpha TaxID=28320 RepID=A0A2T5B1K8_MYCDI|nr:hypothetical protein C7449_107270 [Mycoplana dimorpha]
MRVAGGDRRSSLYHPVTTEVVRQGRCAPSVSLASAPGCSARSFLRATTRQFPIGAVRTMTKRQREFDTRNPFIPARSPVCNAAQTALLFCVALAGLVAALISLAIQIAGAAQ